MPYYYPAPDFAAEDISATGDITTTTGTVSAEQLTSTDDANVADQLKLTETPGANGATPTLAFGDLDTGLWESADDTLNVGTNSLTRLTFASGYVMVANLTGVGARLVLNDHTFEVASVISPAALGGDATDYSPTGLSTYASVVRVDPGGANRVINSMAGGNAGRMVWIMNIGTGNTLSLLHDDTSTGTAAMRFFCPNNATLVIPANGSAQVMYDAVSSRWRVLGPVA